MTNADKQNYLLRFNRFQKSREKFYAPKFNAALKSQYNQFIENYKNIGEAAINNISSTPIVRVMKNLYMDSGINYGAKVRSDLNRLVPYRLPNPGDSFHKSIKARLPMGFSERMAQLIAEYFRTDILNQSEGITDTTKDLIRQVFTDAYSQGLGIDDIIAQLQNTELSRIRARLIARTETVTAANRGAMFVAKETGLTLNKEWLSARDSRVRFHHRAENGQIIGVDDFFTVGPDLMQCPGDRGGKEGQSKVSAGNICNCRCTILMIPVEGVAAQPIRVTPRVTHLTMGDDFEARKKELRIPPAWTNVKIDKNKNADLLATGKDAKGRTQYIYSENATMKSAAIKFSRNEELIKKTGDIMKQNIDNMTSNDKSISEPAHVMSLIHSTGIRPGSLKETGAKVQAYGATTLEGRHVIETPDGVRLQFVGKKGVSIDIPVTDLKVAKMLVDRKATAREGKLFNASDSDLRDYTKKLNGGGFKPKDFRTLKGTLTAMLEVSKLTRSKTMAEYQKAVMLIAKKVADILGNTPSIALKSYINPFVFLAIKPI